MSTNQGIDHSLAGRVVNSRIPPILHPLLEDYFLRLNQDLPGFVTGFYLVGSLALDGFNPRQSDIDFTAVISRRAAPADFQRLAEIHRAVGRSYPQWKFEGAYLQPGDPGKYPGETEPFPAHHEGKLSLSRRFELNPITWWILKERGIAAAGPEPGNLPFAVDWERLLAWTLENLNSYWAHWTNRPVQLLAMLGDFGVQWTVLGVLRVFYTFRENGIVTKTQAGVWGLDHLPERWRPIIQEAIRLREGTGEKHYRSRVKRALDARGLLRYIIRSCNEEFNTDGQG